MEKVKKAGCIFVNLENHTIALVLRKKDEYSFPKGHLEDNESLVECAVRETEEETKRSCVLLENEPVYVEEYVTPSGEDVIMYYYLAKDNGSSDNSSLDTHPTFWVPFDEVYDKLSYPSLKKVWNSVKYKVLKYFE